MNGRIGQVLSGKPNMGNEVVQSKCHESIAHKLQLSSGSCDTIRSRNCWHRRSVHCPTIQHAGPMRALRIDPLAIECVDSHSDRSQGTSEWEESSFCRYPIPILGQRKSNRIYVRPVELAIGLNGMLFRAGFLISTDSSEGHGADSTHRAGQETTTGRCRIGM